MPQGRAGGMVPLVAGQLALAGSRLHQMQEPSARWLSPLRKGGRFGDIDNVPTESGQVRSRLVIAMAPNPINLQGLVIAMAPNHVNL